MNDDYANDLPRAGDYRLSALQDLEDSPDVPGRLVDGLPDETTRLGGGHRLRDPWPADDNDPTGGLSGSRTPREARVSRQDSDSGLFAPREPRAEPSGLAGSSYPSREVSPEPLGGPPLHDPAYEAWPAQPTGSAPASHTPGRGQDPYADPYGQHERPYGQHQRFWDQDPYGVTGPYAPSSSAYQQQPDPYGSADPYAQPEQYPWQEPAGGAPTFLERSTVVDPQQGVPAGSTFIEGDGDWQGGYTEYDPYDRGVPEHGGAYQAGPSAGRGRLLRDETDPVMAYPAEARQLDDDYQFYDSGSGFSAALLDMSDRRWFSVVLTGGLGVILAAIIWAAFTLGSNDGDPESVLAATTVTDPTTSSDPEASAGAATTLDLTGTTVNDSSSATNLGTVTTQQTTTTAESSTTAASVIVPNVLGLGQVAASNAIEAVGLEVSASVRQVAPGSNQNAVVLEQNPGGGTSAAPGAVVSIVVGEESSNHGS